MPVTIFCQNMKCRSHIIFFSVLLFCSRITAQPADGILAGRYTAQNGLSGNEVIKTLKDAKGYLWVVTHNGISRFDGKTFKNFTHIPTDSTSLRSIWVTDLVLDHDNIIWASTEWGLCYFDERENRFRYIHPKEDISILYKAPLLVDRTGMLWLAAENGLFSINTRSKKYTLTSLTRIADPQCMTADGRGNIIIGTRGDGIYQYNPARVSYKKLQYEVISPGSHIMSFLNYGSSIWAATEEGMLEIRNDDTAYLFAPGSTTSGTSSVKPLISAAAFQADGQTYFFCGTYDKKIALFNADKKIFTGYWAYNDDPSDKPALVYHIYMEEGTAWLSAQTGLYRVKTGRQYSRFMPLKDKSAIGSAYSVQSILPDRNNPDICWILSEQDNGTLLQYHIPQQRLLKKTAGKSAIPITGLNYGELLQDQSGRLYSFIDHYINIYSPSGDHLKKIKSDRFINCAAFDKEGNAWLGTAEGIACLQLSTMTLRYYDCGFTGTDVERRSLTQAFATSGLVCTDKKNIWLSSTKYGLFRFNKETLQFIPYRQPFSDPYSTLNRCSSLLQKNDTLWTGTMAGLTAFIPATEKFINLNITNGLKSAYVYSICCDATGIIWGRGNQGLFYYEPANGKFTNYILPDSYNDAYFLQNVFAWGNQCVLGLSGGFTVYTPRPQGPAPIQAIFRGIQAENKPVIPAGNSSEVPFLSLLHEQNDIRIDFTAINFSEETVTYRYLLEGLDKNWVDLDEKNQVNFSNLAPGDYTFKVQARLGEDSWGPVKNIISIQIKAAWWQTFAFRIAAVLALAGLITWLYILRIRQLKKRQQEKSKIQQLQLEQYKQELESEQITSFFSSSLVGKESIQDVLTDVAKNLIGKLGFEDCMIYLWNADKSKLIQFAGHGIKGAIENSADKEKYHIPAGKGIIGASVSQKQPLLINDTSADSRYISADGILRQSELCVPVMTDDEVTGAINIEHSTKGFFNRHHVQMVSTIATLVANKIKAIESSSALYQKQLELSETSRQLAEREVAMLRSQMNPHFIFNSLNSIQKYIWENKEEDAAEYLASFAKLMRSILENSRHEFITLQKETEFLKLYIELEHRRSNNSFNYSITLDESLDPAHILIPPLLLQPFIENAIWHGLNKKQGKGNLLVSMRQVNGQLECIVDDDGAGRPAVQDIAPPRKSLGISITRQRIERLMETTHQLASVTISDKINNGIAAGTTVTVILPMQTDNNHA